MKISKIILIYFSPTGTSKKVITALSEGFKGVETREAVDLTYPSTTRQMSMQPGELAVIGLPVYAGRLPALAVDRMKQIDGKNCPAVVAVLYGNWEYEDALIELCQLARSISFKVVGACSFSGEHSFSSPDIPIAHGDRIPLICYRQGSLARRLINCFRTLSTATCSHHMYQAMSLIKMAWAPCLLHRK